MSTNARHAAELRLPMYQRGLSLVELMVALTLGLLITAGLLQLFNTSKITFNTNDAIARVQESGRFALELLQRDLREAGTHGFCATRIRIRNHLNPSCSGYTGFYGAEQSVSGWDYVGTGSGDDFVMPETLDPGAANAADWQSTVPGAGSLPDPLEGLVVPGSDVLIVRRMEAIAGLTATGATGAEANAIPLGDADGNQQSHGLPDDAIVLVTNCTRADLFQNTNNGNASSFAAGNSSCSNPGPGNLNSGCREGENVVSCDWSADYGPSMQAFQVVTTAYFIGASQDNQGRWNPGLYRMDLGTGTNDAVAEELVRGVENLQIRYGYSNAAPAGDGQSINAWPTANEVPADGWGQVLAFQIGLSIRSDEFADGDQVSQVFDLAAVNVASQADGRMRHAFSSTVAMRNRILVF